MDFRLDLFICAYFINLCLIPLIFLKRIINNNIRKIKHKIFLVLFIFLYGFCLIILTLCEIKINFKNNIIYFSFKVYESLQIKFDFDFSLYNFLINFVLFFPFGILLKTSNYIFNKKFKPLKFGLILGLFIEVTQLLLPINRVVDIIDILFDGASTFISFYIIKTPKLALLLKK